MGFDLSQINKRLLHLIEIRKNLTNTYERNLKELNDEIAIEQNNLKRVSEILSPYICRYCGGSGEEGFMDAAGSRDTRRCKYCNGSGIRTEEQDGSINAENKRS